MENEPDNNYSLSTFIYDMNMRFTIYGYINTQDRTHEKIVLAMKNIVLDTFGSIFISNFIYDEILTLAPYRTKNCLVGEKIQPFVKKEVKGKKIIHMILIDGILMEKTNELYEK